MIDKIIGRCKADRRAIEMLDEDQKEYLRRNAKAFLAARMKKMKRRDRENGEGAAEQPEPHQHVRARPTAIAALKKGASTGIRMKVSEKGAVSIYGMGRFPVTLYKEQWLKLLVMSADIRAFIAANEAQLKTKEKNG
jgi:hypothetical protein